jgi:hypothetical protein
MVVLGIGAAGLLLVYCLTWQQSVNKYNGKGCVVLMSVPNNILLTEFTYSQYNPNERIFCVLTLF